MSFLTSEACLAPVKIMLALWCSLDTNERERGGLVLK